MLAVDEVPGGWGRWGLGPAAVFPTANSDLLGQGKWQLGVSAALILSNVPNWQIGMVATEYDRSAAARRGPQSTSSCSSRR